MAKQGRLYPLRWIFSIFLLLGLAHPVFFAAAQDEGRTAPVLAIQGAIGPATSDYVVRGIAAAAQEGAPFVLLRMDTPGGLDTSMREIIREIVNSPVPVVTYVSPSGARAASAGAFILMASHVAVMAPGTNVGAATPVQLGGSNPFSGGSEDEAEEADQPAAQSGSATDAKAINDAIAYIRSLAEMRGRDADWAEAAVREAASLSANAALDRGVIDLVAADNAELLAQLDGRVVRVGVGEVTLDTQGLTLVQMEPNWRTKLLGAITDPNIALILMMIGVYGLLFEFMNPGALYPGTIGGISLLVGLYALSALPVSYAGIALILLGMALMAAEAFSPSFGILGIGGVIAFILGATIMFDTDIPQFQVAFPVLAAVAVASLGMTLLIARLALTSRRTRVSSGREQLEGASGTVLDWSGEKGHIHVHGERWSARSAGKLKPGEKVNVTGIDGLTLEVEPAV